MIKNIRASAYRSLSSASIAYLAVAAASMLSGCASESGPTRDPVLQQHMYTPGVERPPTGGRN